MKTHSFLRVGANVSLSYGHDSRQEAKTYLMPPAIMDSGKLTVTRSTRVGSARDLSNNSLSRTRLAPQELKHFTRVIPAPGHWKQPCTNTECTLHQISPYVGKLKSAIARDLVKKYSRTGDLVVDPFVGAGTILFEAALAGRNTFGSDISPYALALSRAKLFPPRSLEEALRKAEYCLSSAARQPAPDLRLVPNWVRDFFHPETLKEAINFAYICRHPGNEFLMACLLGILHHQRPGFLSYTLTCPACRGYSSSK
jgi:hypothetical protein